MEVTEAIRNALHAEILAMERESGGKGAELSEMTPDQRHMLDRLAAAAITAMRALEPRASSDGVVERAEAIVQGVEWAMDNCLPAQGESGADCERRRLVEAIAAELEEVRAGALQSQSNEARLREAHRAMRWVYENGGNFPALNSRADLATPEEKK